MVRRADADFTEVLVVAPTVEKVRAFFAAVRTALADVPGHLLNPDDLGFAVAGANSNHLGADEFLDLFRGNSREILVIVKYRVSG